MLIKMTQKGFGPTFSLLILSLHLGLWPSIVSAKKSSLTLTLNITDQQILLNLPTDGKVQETELFFRGSLPSSSGHVWRANSPQGEGGFILIITDYISFTGMFADTLPGYFIHERNPSDQVVSSNQELFSIEEYEAYLSTFSFVYPDGEVGAGRVVAIDYSGKEYGGRYLLLLAQAEESVWSANLEEQFNQVIDSIQFKPNAVMFNPLMLEADLKKIYNPHSISLRQ